ncbi:MAG: hypothetical protein GZ090_09445 [Oxalobacteraceae bacterium]|nr:hypothetical protein [Oxalobacteraceae bacterium]
MQISPQTISPEITAKLNVILQAGKYVTEDDWNWRQIKRECEKLRDIHPSSGWSMLSLAHGLTGNIAVAQHAFEAAIALEKNPLYITNWLATLGNLGLYLKIHELFAVYGNPISGEFSDRFEIGLHAGAFHKLTEFIGSAEKMRLDMTTLDTSLPKNIAALLRKAGVTDHDVARQLEAAGTVLNRHKLFYTGAPEISVCDIPDAFIGVTFAFTLPVDGKDIFSYNIQLAKEEMAMNIQKNHAFDVVFVQR